MRTLTLLTLILLGSSAAAARSPLQHWRVPRHRSHAVERAPALRGVGVAAQLVPSNPAISSVYLLPADDIGRKVPSVRIPPNWSYAIAFSHATFVSSAPTPSTPVVYSASLAPAGDALPAWLTFDELGLFLFGVAPSSGGVWAVQLCGSERAGASTDVCEGFEVVVDATPRPGEVRAGEVAQSSTSTLSVSASTATPSSFSAFSSSTTTLALSPSASPTMGPSSARVLQRLNITAVLIQQTWTPLTTELSAVLDGHERSIVVDCSAVNGLAWSDRTGLFTGDLPADLVTDESYPSTPWTLSRSPLRLPVVVEYSNGSSLLLELPLSIYPALLLAGPAYGADTAATPGEVFVLNVASDAVDAPVDGIRPEVSVTLEPREAASWLDYDPTSGWLSATAPRTSVDATGPGTGDAVGVVPSDLAYSSVAVIVEARDPVTKATSRRQRTITVLPRQPHGLYPNLRLTGMRLVGVVIGSVAGLALFVLLIYLSRRPNRRAQWSAKLQTAFDRHRPDDQEWPPASLSAAPGPRQMVQHSILTEIDELKYDSERGAFDTSSPTHDLGLGRLTPSSSAQNTLPHSTSTFTLRFASPSASALSVAVGRIVSLTRRIVSGSTDSTKVASFTDKDAALSTATTYSQETTSSFIYVFSVRGKPTDGSDDSRCSVTSSASMSSLGTPLPPPQAARTADSQTELPSTAAALITIRRLGSASSGSPDPPSLSARDVSRASWESPTTYEWSAKSRKSACDRPSGETPSVDRLPRRSLGESGDVSLPSAYSACSVVGRPSVDKPTSLSSAHSHEQVVIACAQRASSSCAMHVRFSGAPSSLISTFAPEPAAPASAVVVDSDPTETQRAQPASPSDEGSLVGLAVALDREGDRSFIVDLSDDRFGSDYTSSGGSFEGFYPIDDVPTIVPYVEDSSESLGPPCGRSFPDFSPDVRTARIPSSASLSAVAAAANADASSSSGSVRYEARLNEPFVLHPIYDLSVAPKRPGVVRALRVTSIGTEPLPPWIAFRGGVFEGMPMDGDEGDWDFVVTDSLLDRLLCLFTLRVVPISPRSSLFTPSASAPFTSGGSPSASASSDAASSAMSGLSATLTSPTPAPRAVLPAVPREIHRPLVRPDQAPLFQSSAGIAV